MSTPVTADGRCSCCGSSAVTSGGCIACNSSRTLCGCGAVLLCGCGRTSGDHRCPNIWLIPTATTPVCP